MSQASPGIRFAAGLCLALAPAQVRSLGIPGATYRALRGASPYLETGVAAVHRSDGPDAAVRQVLGMLGAFDLSDGGRPEPGRGAPACP